jgi:hypothetical protein
LSYGLQLPPELQKPHVHAQGGPQARRDRTDASGVVTNEASRYGLAEALANPIAEVRGNSIAEAIAVMLANGINARNLAGVRQDALNRQTAQDKTAMGEALEDRTWEREDRAYETGEREREAEERRRTEEMIASLPEDQQALARLNPQAFVAQMMRHRFPTPSAPRSGGVDSSPPLPDGFVLD